MFEEMLGIGAGGGELQPAPPGTPPEQLTAQWGEFLKNPKTQAALLNFGLEMMKPRWNSASALPDALGAGIKAAGGMEEEERTLAEKRRAEGVALGQKSADRENRLEAARIGADSRADVANIRAGAALEAAHLRHSVRPGVEQKLYDQARKEFISGHKAAWDRDFSKLGKPYPTPEQIAAEADTFARQRVQSLNIGTLFGQGGGGPPNHQADTRPNSAPTAPSVGSPGGAQTPNPTSVNPTNQGGVSSKDLINRLLASSSGGTQDKLRELQAIANDPAKLARMRQAVKDPDQLEALVQQMLRRLR